MGYESVYFTELQTFQEFQPYIDQGLAMVGWDAIVTGLTPSIQFTQFAFVHVGGER